MNNEETEIIKAIADHLALAPEDLDRQALLRDDLNLGPIELNDLLDSLAQRFGVTFEPDDVEHIKKVEDLVMLIEDNLLD